MTVLVLARTFDPTADAVVTALRQRSVPVFRCDLADFPTRLRLRAELRSGRWGGTLENDHHTVDLGAIRSIWCRNPSTYRFSAALDSPDTAFCYREAKLGLGGVLASLDATWANPPHSMALLKPYQWRAAAECGLPVARTVITNDPRHAEHFVNSCRGDVAVKALGPSGIQRGGRTWVSLTRRFTPEDRDHLDEVAVTASTLQTFVPKAHEVRLTIIGSAWFPIAIHAHSAAAVQDWRAEPTALTYEPTVVPHAVRVGVEEYMSRMRLLYAALDFVVTPCGDWVFLEANTGPQFGWLEAATGAPMTAAMAEMLAAATP